MNEQNEMRIIDAPQMTMEIVPAATPAHLLQMAVSQGADLAKLEKLMDLQEHWEANEAKKAYNRAFAAFKAEAVSIIKTANTTSGPLTGRKYADKNDVVLAATPALSRFGLSSSWKITKDEKDWIEVTCYLRHESGHQESVSMGGPPDSGGAKNALQARASTNSYLERYTLKAITGLSEKGDDNDGNSERVQAKSKARTPLKEKGFNAALDAIRAGTTTAAKVKSDYELTEDQIIVIDEVQKESK